MRRNGMFITAAAMLFMVVCGSCERYMDQLKLDRLSDEVQISPSIASPVAYGSFSIQDVLESLNDSAGFISIDEDSLIQIIYSDTVISLDASSLLDLPAVATTETYFSSDVDIPDWDILPEGSQYTFYKHDSIQFSFEEEDRVDSVVVLSGTLEMDAFSEFKHPGVLQVTSSNVFDPAGDSLNRSFTISQSDGTYAETRFFDLDGYTLTMDEHGDSQEAVLNFKLTLTKTASPITAGEQAGVICIFSDIVYGAVYGQVAEREITSLDQSIDVGIFSILDEVPEVYFADPQLGFNIDNSFGVPIVINFDTILSRAAGDGSLTLLEFKNPSPNPFVINAPTIDQEGETVTTEINLTTENCNIDELISSIPDQMEFDLDASSGDPAEYPGQMFVLNESRIQVGIEAILPMWLSTTGYTLQDTLEMAFDSLLMELSFLDEAAFRLTSTNEWPLEVSMQIYFIDDQDNRIDSLFDEQTPVLEAAPVDADGEIDRNALQEYQLDVSLTGADLEALDGATKVVLRARAVTTDNGSKTVKFYSSYLLNYKLSVGADFTFNSRELNFE